jgi:hypothetical protein
MATDPLSSATRTAKRNLLLTATVAITYSAFDVSISKIPVGGLAIEFDNRVFAFLLIAVLLYFLVTFALYYFIDIRNVEKTKHQSEKEILYKAARDSFWNRHAASVLKKIGKSLPKGVGYNNANAGQQLGNLFQNTQEPFFDESTIVHMAATMTDVMNFTKEPTSRDRQKKPISRDQDPALYEAVEKKLRRAILQYRRKQRVHALMLLPSLYGVRVLYFVRNYLVDGVFPFVLAIFALAAVFQLIDLHWLRAWVPTPRAS